MELSAAEIGLVRWLRSLNQRTLNAIYLYFMTGDDTLLLIEFTRHNLRVAA